MSLENKIMNIAAVKTENEIKKEISAAICNPLLAAYLTGHRDARHKATELAADQKKGLTTKELEAVLVAAYSVEKKSRKDMGKNEINCQEILNLVLGMIQEKLQVKFCSTCGRILPHENCFDAKAERG